MKCFNCNKPIPDGARRCLHCEADQTKMADMTPEDMEAAVKALEQTAPGAMDKLGAMASGFDTAEDFVNALFVGACPSCNSTDVGTFEDVIGVEDPTVARCFSCGRIWCTECLQPMAEPNVRCGHWDVCDDCDEEEKCEFIGASIECPKVSAWIAKQSGGTSQDAANSKRPN